MQSALRATLLIAAIASSSLATAQSNSDGVWAVSIVTHSGDCARSINSSIHVREGRIEEQGMFATVSGRIGPSGRVALRVVSNSDTIAAQGAVKGEAARGAWTSRASNCSGSWTATRSGAA